MNWWIKMSAEFTDKRCYTIWQTFIYTKSRAGGKIVWLSDNELLLAQIKYPRKEFDAVVEEDIFEKYGKYIDATIE